MQICRIQCDRRVTVSSSETKNFGQLNYRNLLVNSNNIFVHKFSLEPVSRQKALAYLNIWFCLE